MKFCVVNHKHVLCNSVGLVVKQKHNILRSLDVHLISETRVGAIMLSYLKHRDFGVHPTSSTANIFYKVGHHLVEDVGSATTP